MEDKIWYDVIDRTTGNREIVFSTKIKEDAIAKAHELNANSHKVYINENILFNKHLSRNVINDWNGFKEFVVKFGDD